MSSLQQMRHIVAVKAHWALMCIGVATILFSPFAVVLANVALAVLLMLGGILAVAMSIQMARSLDVQRKVRKLATAKATSPPSSHKSGSAPYQKTSPAPLQRVQPTASERAVSPAKQEKWKSTARAAGADVTAGRLLARDGTEGLPVIAFDMTRMEEERISGVVESIAAHQLITGAFKPLCIIDQPDFGPVRAYGYLTELLISPREWSEDQGSRADYVRRRLDSIVSTYGCSAVIRPSAEGLGDISLALVDKTIADWAKDHNVALPQVALRGAVGPEDGDGRCATST